MAINRNGINGHFSGKIGNVVGYDFMGQQVIRTIPKKRTSPPTPKELLNRQKFAASQYWLEPLTDFLRIGFKDYRPTFQGFVAAKSYNQKNALVYKQDEGFSIDPALALVSFGTQPLPLSAEAIANQNQEVVINWSTEAPAAYNDQTMLIAYDIQHRKVVYHTAAARRSAGTARLAFPKEDEGKTYHFYLAFIADDRSTKSNSMYLGNLTIL